VKRKEVLVEVNKWAEEATQGLIKSVLCEGSFDSSTGVDFKFYLLDGKSIEVPFMTNSEI
ncbi:hypothetical protein FRX31_006845, partial [Thalictrum thalictroides]